MLLEDGGATESLTLTKATQQATLKAGLLAKVDAPLGEFCGNTDAMVKGTMFNLALLAWMDAVAALLGVSPPAPVTSNPAFQTATAGAKTALGLALSLKAKVG